MLQCFYLMFALFIFTKNVHGLICYTSDFGSLQLGNIKKLSYELQDCHNYNNNVKQVSQELQIPENVTLHCYTVEVSRDVVVRGCVPSGGCHYLMDTVKNVVQQFGKVEEEDTRTDVAKMQCIECNENECNKNQISDEKIDPVPLGSYTAQRSETSLKCYHCSPEPCKSSEARERICGVNIAKSQEAVCTLEIPINSSTPLSAVRKCTVVPRNTKPDCPDGFVCTYCKSDLCNTEEVVFSRDPGTRTLIQGEASGQTVKCYFCSEPCEVSKAQQRTCGETISASQEAVCTTQVAKDSKNPNEAIRKCQIVSKGTEPNCPATADCKSCKDDLCNGASSIGSKTALVGVFAAFFATKLLLH